MWNLVIQNNVMPECQALLWKGGGFNTMVQGSVYSLLEALVTGYIWNMLNYFDRSGNCGLQMAPPSQIKLLNWRVYQISYLEMIPNVCDLRKILQVSHSQTELWLSGEPRKPARKQQNPRKSCTLYNYGIVAQMRSYRHGPVGHGRCQSKNVGTTAVCHWSSVCLGTPRLHKYIFSH